MKEQKTTLERDWGEAIQGMMRRYMLPPGRRRSTAPRSGPAVAQLRIAKSLVAAPFLIAGFVGFLVVVFLEVMLLTVVLVMRIVGLA